MAFAAKTEFLATIQDSDNEKWDKENLQLNIQIIPAIELVGKMINKDNAWILKNIPQKTVIVLAAKFCGLLKDDDTPNIGPSDKYH